MKPDLIDLKIFHWFMNYIDKLPSPQFGNDLGFAAYYFKIFNLILFSGLIIWLIVNHYVKTKNTRLYGLKRKD